jgi:hypothetical protein
LVIAVVYVLVVAVLTWSWIRTGPDGFSAAELASIVLVLPAGLVLLPVAYLVLAAAWAVTGSSQENGSTPVVIQVVYVVVFALLACANAVVVTAGARYLRKGRGADRTADSADA